MLRLSAAMSDSSLSGACSGLRSEAVAAQLSLAGQAMLPAASLWTVGLLDGASAGDCRGLLELRQVERHGLSVLRPRDLRPPGSTKSAGDRERRVIRAGIEYRERHAGIRPGANSDKQRPPETYEAAHDEGYQVGYGSTHCAWEDSTFVTGFTAQALVVRHLLEPEAFDRLYHLWGDVFGPPSSATVEDESPTWPPAVAFEPSCGAPACLHGAAIRQSKRTDRMSALVRRIRGRREG